MVNRRQWIEERGNTIASRIEWNLMWVNVKRIIGRCFYFHPTHTHKSIAAAELSLFFALLSISPPLSFWFLSSLVSLSRVTSLSLSPTTLLFARPICSPSCLIHYHTTRPLTTDKTPVIRAANWSNSIIQINWFAILQCAKQCSDSNAYRTTHSTYSHLFAICINAWRTIISN